MRDGSMIAFWGSVACANVWFASGNTIGGFVWLAWSAIILIDNVVGEAK